MTTDAPAIDALPVGAEQNRQPTPPQVDPATVASPRRELSIASFAVGLSSFFSSWTILVPLAALVLGFIALKKEPGAKGYAITGTILGAVNLVLGVLGIILLVVSVNSLLSFLSGLDPSQFQLPSQPGGGDYSEYGDLFS